MFLCLLFGHTSKECRGRNECKNCGEIIEHEETQDHETCQTECYFCKNYGHKATSRISDAIKINAFDLLRKENTQKVKIMN